MTEPKKKRVRKPRPPSITSRHPGSAEVAKAMDWSVEVARLVADLPGCPLVRGGKGRRFTSVEAVKLWFDALPIEQRCFVPAIDREERLKLGEEIAALTWHGADEAAALARHERAELVVMRDRWKVVDERDRRAAVPS